MLVSYRWLESFFEKPLPGVESVCEALTFGVFEIEGTEQKGDDTIIDVKVLPDRACYALSHRGIAKEISTLLSLPMKDDPLKKEMPVLEPVAEGVALVVDDAKVNPVHTLALVKGVEVKESPEWLRKALESLGQRSINNVVDATNYVMLHIGQPTHAFDWNKLTEKEGSRGIRVRLSEEGETITLLGGGEHTLPQGIAMLCDAHSNTPLDIAGVKGGIVAELDGKTTDVLITAATFDPIAVRRAATHLGIKTDASKRFENTVPDELPFYAVEMVVKLIEDIANGISAGYVHTETERPSLPFKVGVSARELQDILGVPFSDQRIEESLQKLGFSYERIEEPREKIVKTALSALGAPYKRMARIRFDTPNAFNCATLTAWCAIEAGYSFGTARITIDQFVYLPDIAEQDVQPGDFVFTNTEVIRTTEGENYSSVLGEMVKDVAIRDTTLEFMSGFKVGHGVDHVGIYIGDGTIVHAGSGVGGAVQEQLAESETFAKQKWYKRVVSVDEVRYAVTIPFERLDVRIKEDLVEEIGRVIGYDTIPETTLSPQGVQTTNQPHAVAEKVRTLLDEQGFLEVRTYALTDSGDALLVNPFASDKKFLRSNLSQGMLRALDMGVYNLPLTGKDNLCLYELGTVFGAKEEEFHLSLGVHVPTGKKQAERATEILEAGKQAVLAVFPKAVLVSEKEGCVEYSLAPCIEFGTFDTYPKAARIAAGVRYAPISNYPFVLRDIALWVPEGTPREEVSDELKTHAGGALVRLDLFDEFQKEGRTSYAFHLVFQAMDRTLSDEEVGVWMRAVEDACAAKGWEVR